MSATDILRQSHEGIVGIDEQGSVFGGYDEQWLDASGALVELDGAKVMSEKERLQLADAMIERWRQFRDKARRIVL